MIISETFLKIKRTGKLPRIALESLILAIILSIVFFLGKSFIKKTSVSNQIPVVQNSKPVTLDISSNTITPKQDTPKSPLREGEATPQNFVASKTGKVYYPSSCKALNRIKPANRIYFATQSSALAKHLTLSKSCK